MSRRIVTMGEGKFESCMSMLKTPEGASWTTRLLTKRYGHISILKNLITYVTVVYDAPHT